MPSIDGLLAIRDRLTEVTRDARAVDSIDKQLDTFVVMAPPKNWKNEGLARKCLERYQTAAAHKTVAKIREALAKKKRNESDIARLSSELLGQLEPWTELAMAGQVYARYLDPSDLIVSEDGMLLRKHAFVQLSIISGKRAFLGPAVFTPSSEGEGSFFSGGFGEFSLASGQARAIGNHVGSPTGTAIAGALFGSIRGTDWRLVTSSAVQGFAARVRLAREWTVESAGSREMLSELDEQSRGLLSLTRRAKLIDGIQSRNWPAVWDSVSISDLYFLGDSLIERSPAKFWRSPTLQAMKRAAGAAGSCDGLGQVAPDLSGSAVTRLQRYEPYEEYERYLMPDRLAERVAELKLYLAWQADSLAWPPEAIAHVASPAADAVIKKLRAGGIHDWMAALDAYRSLDSDALEFLLSKQ